MILEIELHCSLLFTKMSHFTSKGIKVHSVYGEYLNQAAQNGPGPKKEFTFE